MTGLKQTKQHTAFDSSQPPNSQWDHTSCNTDAHHLDGLPDDSPSPSAEGAEGLDPGTSSARSSGESGGSPGLCSCFRSRGVRGSHTDPLTDVRQEVGDRLVPAKLQGLGRTSHRRQSAEGLRPGCEDLAKALSAALGLRGKGELEDGTPGL